ncbi:MAG: class F sortase [Pseudonocardiaceae bacterium]
MPTRSDRCGGRGGFAAAVAAVLAALLLVACSSARSPDEPGPPTAVDVPASAVPAVPPRPILAESLPASEPLSVEIPAIGVSTDELIALGLTGDGALEVPGDAVTAGWFDLSPTPGEIGPSVIAGHVDYASVPGVFVRLHEMRSGDTITVHRIDGSSAVFTTYQIDRYPKSAFPTEKVYGDTETPQLRLITCGGSFDDASGEYVDNVVVFARLTSAYWR